MVAQMPDVEGLVQKGIAAIKAGRKAEARRLLEQAVEIDVYNEKAWLWLSAAVDTLDEQQICLANVIEINPNSEKAKKGLAAINSARNKQPKSSTGKFSNWNEFSD